MHISPSAAKRLALHCQLLDGRTKLPSGKEGVAQIIEKLGYVQLDTIAVIRRAHHHTLWTRRSDYVPNMLHELQAVDRRIFEYWGHAASYLPMKDYRFSLPRMRRSDDPHSKWEKDRLKKCGHLMPEVLKRIRAEGPLSSADFARTDDGKRGPWWDWRPTKVALELLFLRGELMITERRKFHRVYDLTERVLPSDTDTTAPSDSEWGQFLVRRALGSYGVATAMDIREHIRGASKEIITAALNELIESGQVTCVTVGPDKDGQWYGLSDCLQDISLRKTQPRLHLLSPFDNMIIQRERLRQLFDFNYTIECYVPAPKRKYGYFTLPILWGEEFVGRLDPKADRKKRLLIVRSVHLEPAFTADDRFMTALATKLRELTAFNECDRIQVESTFPGKIKRALQSQIKRFRR